MKAEELIAEIKGITDVLKHWKIKVPKTLEAIDYNSLRKIHAWLTTFQLDHHGKYDEVFTNVPPEARHEPPEKYWEKLLAIGEFDFPEQERLRSSLKAMQEAWKSRPEIMKGFRRVKKQSGSAAQSAHQEAQSVDSQNR